MDPCPRPCPGNPFRRPTAGAGSIRLALAGLLALAGVAPAADKAPGTTATAGGTAAAGPTWHQRVLTGLEIGPTGAHFGHSDSNDTRFAARFDGREMVRRTLAAHGEYLVLWVRDGDYAYYDSRLLPKAPGLGARDPLREAVEAARPHRLPILSYCVVQQGGHFLKANPQFEMRGADGKPLGRFCLNSGYLDAMKGIVAEQLAYGIDGFHIDMLDQGFGPPYGCWCEACRGAFQKEHGRPMPAGVTWDADWDRMLEFRYASSDRFERELTAHIRRLNPRASVDFNYHGNPPFSFEVGQRPVQHAQHGDFVTGETGVWGFSAMTVGLNAAFYRAATPGRRVQVAMQRGVRMYHDQTTRPLHDQRWELFTLLAHGAFVTMVDKTGLDGSLDPVAYDRFEALFGEAARKRRHFGHRPVADVGIYFSHRTRDWVGREKPAAWFQSFLGAHQALAQEHIPWDILLDENTTFESLRRFPVVLLPNVGIVSAAEAALFRRYVEEGGNLIVTGQTGCFDRHGRATNVHALEGLIGARLVQPLESLDNWVRFPAWPPPGTGTRGTLRSGPPTRAEQAAARADRLNFFAPGLLREGPNQWPFLVKGPALSLQPTTARPIGELLRPHRTTRQREGREGTEWPMSPDSPVGPAILLHHVGLGSVLTFAGSPDAATASEHHVVEARRLLANAVRMLHERPLVRINAPANVETVVTDDPATRTLRIHLLGYNTPPQTLPARERPYVLPRPIEDPPMFRVTVESSRPLSRATALNRTTEIKRRGQKVEATVLDIHEVLLLNYRP